VDNNGEFFVRKEDSGKIVPLTRLLTSEFQFQPALVYMSILFVREDSQTVHVMPAETPLVLCDAAAS